MIHTIPCGPLEVNTYIVYGQQDGACIVIDPADNNPVLAFLQENRLHCTGILLTHGHFDHTLGVAKLQEKTHAQVIIHAEDAPMLLSDEASMAVYMGEHLTPVQTDMPLAGGETFELAGQTIRVLHTPGHTSGSVCYLFEAENTICSGDTLFRLNVGRSDLPGGDENRLYQSIRDILFSLNGNYEVCPGHGRHTTLAFEKKHNPFMRNFEAHPW